MDQLARATAQRFGLCHVDLSSFKIDLAALNLLSAQAARRLNAAPIGFDDSGRLRVAISDPSNVIALDDLKLMTGHEVQPVVASADDIQGLIGRMSRLDEAVAEAVQEGEAELADVTEIRESADDAPVIKLVNSIIAQAVEDARLGHPLRARGPRHAGALPRRRRAARDDHHPAADGRRHGLAHEDHGQPRHRREARAAGRPRVAHRRRARDRHRAWSRCRASTARAS